jgi:lipocalin
MPAFLSRASVRAFLLALALVAARGVDAGNTTVGPGGTWKPWFSRLFSRGSARGENTETTCAPVPTASPFDLAAYVESHPWYVQEQQPNGYQPENSLFCVRAVYAFEDETRTSVSVYNTANENSVTGPQRNARGTKLRAIVPDADVPSKLRVGPRFVPSALYGPYWVVAVKPTDAPRGEDDPRGPPGYDWAVVSGGQPTVRGNEEGTCRPKLTGTNGAGLWIFTRDPIPPREVVEEARAAARDLGFDLSEMRTVEHAGCAYPDDE